jgi:hypothetical protein
MKGNGITASASSEDKPCYVLPVDCCSHLVVSCSLYCYSITFCNSLQHLISIGLIDHIFQDKMVMPVANQSKAEVKRKAAKQC